MCIRDSSYAALNRCFAAEKWQETGWQTKALQPLTQTVWQPDPVLSGEGRLDAMIQGAVQSRHGQKVMGTPQECAEAIIDYLLQQGLLQQKQNQ